MSEFLFLNPENNYNEIFYTDLICEDTYNKSLLYPDCLSYRLDEIINYQPLANANNTEKSDLFKVTKIKKCESKIQKELSGKKRNRAMDKDNIICKIQIHFFNFLVNFANDAIKAEFKDKEVTNLEFKLIKHEIKKQITNKNIKEFIHEPISAILQMEISKKHKKLSLEKDYNKNVYNKVIALSDWLKKLFKMNFLDAFKLYYNNCQKLDSINFEGQAINFSIETLSFQNLYNKAETEEKKSRLKLIAENYYSKLRNRKIFKVQTKFKKGI